MIHQYGNVEALPIVWEIRKKQLLWNFFSSLGFDPHRIVAEVRSIKFNIEQEQEIVLRSIRGASISETALANEVMQGKAGDVLTALSNLEKVQRLHLESWKGAVGWGSFPCGC